jgi:hypothetical protein
VVQLRVVNAERTRFTSIVPVTILRPTVEILTPNGGEQFEPGLPVTVTWKGSNTGALRLEYSNDNGVTWKAIASALAPESGSYTFTPPADATRFAFVRLVDPSHVNASDLNDRPFEILKGRSISILAPASGDYVTRAAQSLIVWDASRIASVDIFYSMNDGKDWQLIAGNVAGGSGNYAWNVPDEVSDRAKIRIVEVGGATVAETGTFSIVTRAPIGVRVLAPNGGETYMRGDTVQVRWSSSSITTPVAVAYSSDGVTWRTIGTPLATAGTLNWVADVPPGANYRVRVGTGNIIDASDAAFTVVPRRDPAITVAAPNGGERFAIDSVVEVRWSAENIGGDVAIAYSIDGGANWKNAGTASAALGSFTWRVPASETELGLIRVSSSAGASDISDAHFAIVRPASPAITLVAPNGGERLRQNSDETIRWNAVESTLVNIEYSVDLGATWTSVRNDIASVPGANVYQWHTPAFSLDVANAALVRIVNAADGSVADLSDNPFSLMQIAGSHGVAGIGATRSLGNYPNPFTSSTEVRWMQAAPARAEIRLYDGAGRLVGYYDAGDRAEGEQRFELLATGLPGGFYLCELKIGTMVLRDVMMVAR